MSDATLSPEATRDRSFVVTGGCGFIGSHLCRRLSELGAKRVVAIDSLRYGDLSNLRDTSRVEVVRHTLGTDDPVSLHAALAGADGLFHLAAEKHNQSKDSPSAVLRANVEGTHGLLEAAAVAKIPRVVFSSSLYAYGRMTGSPMREDEVPRPTTVYGISKLAGEHMLSHFAKEGAFSTRALRYFFVYGPRQWAGMGYKSVIVKNAERLRAGERPIVFGDGQQSLDYVFVDDVVDATIRALLLRVAEPYQTEVINIGSGHATTVDELLDTLCRAAGRKYEPLHEPADWTADSRRVSDPARAHALLGWRATTSLEEGLRKVWSWLETSGRLA